MQRGASAGALDSAAMEAPGSISLLETAWHAEGDLDVVLKQLGSSLSGLSHEEAQQRLAKFGRNALTPPPKPSFWRRLWNQINT